TGHEYNRDGFGCRLCRKRRWRIPGDDHGGAAADQFTRQRGQTVVLTLSPTPFDVYVVTFDETGVLQSSDEDGHCAGEGIRGRAAQKPDHPSRLLRACQRRPRCRAAEKGDELAPSHSITSSAVASSIGGTERPRALAVLRLIARLNLVGCSIG